MNAKISRSLDKDITGYDSLTSAADFEGHANGSDADSTDSAAQPHDLDDLKKILLGSNHAALVDFADCLNDPERYKEHLSALVTESIAQRDKADGSVAGLLAPIVEKSLGESVRTNPDPLADALFPIMGPAIRRSISDTMNQALEGFNKALEQSFSVQALKWRFDAMRSGRSYAEIAMLATLDFRVEQLFLIHRETSILIDHLVDDAAIAKDADMVSAMLSAILDFVSDSFDVSDGELLDTLRLGELTICVETGPKAMLAAVVQGSVPESLRLKMRETLEAIHQKHRLPLAEFDGDATTLAEARPLLEGCMLSQTPKKKPKSSATPWKPIVAALLVLAVIAYFFWKSWQTEQQWQQVLQKLEAEPGYVVLSATKDDGYRVRLLKDPLARQPERIIPNQAQTELNVQIEAEPYMALDNHFTVKRVKQMVELPDEVKASLVNGSLVLNGRVKQQWLDDRLQSVRSVPGVEKVDISSLQIEPLPPEIIEAPEPTVHERIMANMRSIEKVIFYFESNGTELDNDSIDRIDGLIMDIESLVRDVSVNGGRVSLRVTGYSDTTGSAESNVRISQDRADAVVEQLRARSASIEDIESLGFGSQERPEGINPRQVQLNVSLSYD